MSSSTDAATGGNGSALLPASNGPDLTDDAFLGGRLRLNQPARGHRAGHDAMLLAAAAPGDARRAVDLGAGVGAAGLALAVRVPAVSVSLVEIDPVIAAIAAGNARRQGLEARVEVVVADVATLARPGGPPAPAARSADLVVMNPPFNDPARHRTSPDAVRAGAHMAPDEAVDVWIRAAERLLEPAGRLVLIHRPEALAALLAALDRRFGAVTIRPVHARPDAAAIRLLVGAVKGRRTPPAVLPPLVLADAEGRQSAAAARILRDGEAISGGNA
ncbi:tRNA1(Val) (adenine(37)-N6)-methyltransferase [Ancylobacter terrae]|uniref:tRNA1(Val) (adenine(37)-N6)-methyltransferase n=1 Tax=Ancylobacter sp. sgz301288 TaxID=3342077 RepID=UPI00385B4B83